MVPGSVPALTGVIKLYGAGRLCAPLFAVLGHIDGRRKPVVHPRSGMLETPARASFSMRTLTLQEYIQCGLHVRLVLRSGLPSPTYRLHPVCVVFVSTVGSFRFVYCTRVFDTFSYFWQKQRKIHDVRADTLRGSRPACTKHSTRVPHARHARR